MRTAAWKIGFGFLLVWIGANCYGQEKQHRTARLQFAYLAEGHSHRLLQFSVDAHGRWQPLSPPSIAIHGSAYSLTVDSKQRFVYVPDSDYAYIAQFKIRANGILAPLNPAKVDADSHPTALVIHPKGLFAYVSCSHGDVCQYRIHGNGALQALAPRAVYVGASGYRDPSPVLFDRTGNLASVIVSGGDEEATYRIYHYRGAANGTLHFLRLQTGEGNLAASGLGFASSHTRP